MESSQTRSARQMWVRRLGKPGLLPGLLFVLLLGVTLTARPAGQQPVPNQVGRPAPSPFEGVGDSDPMLAAKQMKALNTERQKAVVSDTDKLLKLATELNQEIGESNPTTLTPVELRKIAEIEKLARNVKQKMSISFTGGPSFDEPISTRPY